MTFGLKFYKSSQESMHFVDTPKLDSCTHFQSPMTKRHAQKTSRNDFLHVNTVNSAARYSTLMHGAPSVTHNIFFFVMAVEEYRAAQFQYRTALSSVNQLFAKPSAAQIVDNLFLIFIMVSCKGERLHHRHHCIEWVQLYVVTKSPNWFQMNKAFENHGKPPLNSAKNP